MYLDITAGIYLSGAGVVILGGIYWKRGTTAAAWVSMIAGSILAGGGFIYKNYFDPTFMNGRLMAFFSVCISIAIYVTVSLLTKDTRFDLDAMLHRKPGMENAIIKRKWWRFGPEFSKSDRVLYISLVVLVVIYFAIFIGVNIYNIRNDVHVSKWVAWWHVYFYLTFFAGSAFLIWIIIGGIRDLIRLFNFLGKERRDITDDGRVNSVASHHEIPAAPSKF
jgi:SSS family solute:Na+ symporter